MPDNDTMEQLTADVVSAYVANNSVPMSQLPEVIQRVHAALMGLVTGAPMEPPTEELKPAVNPKKSVFPDYIVCLNDGKQFSSLKRHLTKLGMTPDQYRIRWNLPSDYPMTAPNYSAKRSELAKSLGLGRKNPGAGRPKKAM